MADTELYDILGVSRHASESDIKKVSTSQTNLLYWVLVYAFLCAFATPKAYHRLAKQYHPDKNPNPDVEEKVSLP